MSACVPVWRVRIVLAMDNFAIHTGTIFTLAEIAKEAGISLSSVYSIEKRHRLSINRKSKYPIKDRYVVDINGCWLWSLGLNDDGYALENTSNGNSNLAHINSYEKHFGKVPIGLELDHKCKLRKCINPFHLEAVTHTENIRRGTNTKLTPTKIVEAFALHKKGVKNVTIARYLNVTESQVSRIFSGKSWPEYKRVMDILELNKRTGKMSTPLRDLSKQFEDKEFTKTYFYGVENGQDVTNRLIRDGASLNSPDLIARLVGWLEEAEPTDDAANKQAQTQQQLASMKLPSQQEEPPKEPGVITGDKSAPPSGESSDGTTRTTSPTTSSSGKSGSFELGAKSSGSK